MSGHGDQRLAEAVLARLSSGPSHVLELLVAARSALGTTLVGHECAVHAVLHRLVRRGLVAPGAPAESGLTPYALASAAARAADVERAPGGAGGRPGAAAVPPDVQRATRGVRDPAARVRVAADVAAHVAELDARGRRSDMGGLRALAGLLKRADRGHPAVFLPVGVGGHVLRFLLHEGPWVLGAVLLYLALNAWVVKVFVIPSASMLPTLQHGDRVVVRKAGSGWRPERWQVVTYQRPGQDGPRTTYVKRVVGLPGEEIALWRGDVYIDGKLVPKPEALSASLRRPVKAWDLTRPDQRQGWFVEGSEAGVDAWNMGERWFTGAHDVERRFELQDVYLELDVDLGAGDFVSLTLMRGREQLDRERFVLLSSPTSGVALQRENQAGSERLAGHPTPLKGRQTLRLSVVDGRVQAAVGEFAWEGRFVGLPSEPAVISFQVGDGVEPLAFRLDKDLHYGLEGVHAVAQDGRAAGPKAVGHRIGPDALFCLGDNTSDSRDSRFQDVGDVPLGQLVGPVIWRLWPPGRFGKP
jgi:signal peptidase I